MSIFDFFLKQVKQVKEKIVPTSQGMRFEVGEGLTEEEEEKAREVIKKKPVETERKSVFDYFVEAGRALPPTKTPVGAIQRMAVEPAREFVESVGELGMKELELGTGIVQEIARFSGGGIGMSLHNLFADIKDPSGESRITEYQPTEDDPKIEQAFKQFIFGKEAVKPAEQLTVDLGDWIKEAGEKGIWEAGKERKDAPAFENIFRKQLMETLEEHPMATAMVAVPVMTVLDFTGFGGGKKTMFKYLAKVDDVADTAKTMRQVGVADDIIEVAAPKIAKIKNADEIARAFDKIELLQKSTKVSRPVSEVSETFARETKKLDNVENFVASKLNAKVRVLDMADEGKSIDFTVGNKLVKTTIKETDNDIFLNTIFTRKADKPSEDLFGTGIGTKAVNALRKYADETNKTLNITDVTKKAVSYWEKFDWLKRKDGIETIVAGRKRVSDISFIYDTKKVVKKTVSSPQKIVSALGEAKRTDPACVKTFRETIKKYPDAIPERVIFSDTIENASEQYLSNIKRGTSKQLEGFTHLRANVDGKIIESKPFIPKGAKAFKEDEILESIAQAKRLDEVPAIPKKKIVPAKIPDKKVRAIKELPKKVEPSLPSRKDVIVSSDLVKEIKKTKDINKTLSSDPLYKKAYSKVVSKITDSKSFNKFKDSVANAWINTREMVEDDWVRVKKLVQRDDIKISEASDPYSAEILMHGRMGTRVEEAKEIVKNIDKDILKLSKDIKKKSDIVSNDIDRYLIARHAPERNLALGDGAAGISTKEAKAVIKEIENLPEGKEIIKIADKMQELNNKTLDVLLEGEVIDKKLYDILRNKYKHHIPLNRVMEDTEDIGSAIAGRPYDVRTTGILKAKGSEKEVADVMTNITNNYEQAIIRAEKNRVDLATLQFARDNKHLGLFNEIKPKAIGKTFDDEGFILEKIDDPTVLVLREKGKPVYLKIEDPNLAVALRGVNRWKVDGVMKGVQAITRFYSQMATRFNPEFFFPNKVRDLQEAVVYMASKKEFGFKGAAKASLRDPKSISSVMDYVRGVDSEGAKLYNQMRLDGGTTGGLGLSTRKKIELDIESIRKINRSNPKKATEKIVETVDNLNQVFEDSTRLSIYKEALDSGATRARAAVLAKEGTINFNKFGKGGPVINAMYMFSNASIQGSVKMLRAMRNPKVAGVVISAVGTAVVATNEWNDKVDPDWRDKVSKWDRMNSLPVVIPTKDGGVTYISIPVSWGIKPIKVAMDYASDIMADKSNIKDAMSGILASVMEGYNPVGGTDLLSAAMPTIFDMPVELARNQGWHGGKIRPDWDKNAPASIKYFDSLKDSVTGRTIIGFSEGLSGVGIEMSPADMKYAYETLVGGAGRFTSKVINTISAVGKQEKPEIRDIPVVSRFLKERKAEQVGAGSKKYESVKKILEDQSRERFILKQNAEDAYNQMKNISKKDAKKMFDEVIKEDPSLAKKINEIIKEEELGLNYVDRLVKQLGVSNGERAKFIVGELNKLKTKEEKKSYYQEMIDKKIISEEVGKQIIYLLNK